MGININDVFPSKYLKAADLNGKTVTLTIKDVGVEQIGDDNKLIVYFHEAKKGLVMNKTNSNNLAMVLGPDTDAWIDQSINVYPTMVDFQGKSMEAIRVKANPRPAGKRVGKSSFPQQGFSDTGPTKPRRDADDPRTMQGHHHRDDPRQLSGDPTDDPNDDIPF